MDGRRFASVCGKLAMLVLVIIPLHPALVQSVRAEDCIPSVSGNVFTINKACTFAGSVDGVDHGTGTTNDAQLKVDSSGNITLGNEQTIGVGTIMMNGGTIHIPTGATIKIKSPLYVTDSDGDLAADGTANTTGGVRYGNVDRITSSQPRDCDPDSALYTYVTTGAKPVAHYQFNETSAPVATDSAGGNNPIVYGTTSTAGKSGKTGDNARSFNGTSDSIIAGQDGFSAVSAYTVSLWIKPSAADAAWAGVIGKPGRNFNFWLGNANTASGFVHHRFHDAAGYNSGCPDSNAVPQGTIPINGTTWTHVSITNDGTTCHTYVNGVPVATGSATGALVVDDTDLQIGRSLDGGASSYYRGSMDDVRIYNYARTEAQVQEDMNGYSPVVRIYAGDNDHDGHATQGTYIDSCAPLDNYGPVQGDSNDLNTYVFQKVNTGTDNDRDRYITEGATVSQNIVGHRFKSSNGYYYHLDASNAISQLYDDGAGSKAGNSDCDDTNISYNVKISGSNPVVHYRFDEGSGNMARDSVNGYNAMSMNAPGIVGGKYGNARSFNGSNTTMMSGYTTSWPTGSAVTAEAWVYPTAYPDGTYNGVLSFGPRTGNNSFLMSVRNNGQLSFAAWGNDAYQTAGGTLTLNAWNHIAISLNGATVKYYINGTLQDTKTLAQTPSITTGYLAVGATDLIGRVWSGYIDEVRIYNYERSQAQVQEDMNNYPYTITQYAGDTDGDGYGTGAATTTCVPLAGYGTESGDCNQAGSNAAYVWTSHAQCYKDNDLDGFTDGLAPNSTCLGGPTCPGAASASLASDGSAASLYAWWGQLKDAANGADCNDNSGNVYYSHAACYMDYDLDGVTVPGGSYTCINSASCNSATWGSIGTGTAYGAYTAGQLKDTVNGSDCNDGSSLTSYANTCYIDVDYDLYPRKCQQTNPTDAYCDASNRWVYTCINTGACNTATYGSYQLNTVYGYGAGQLRSGAEVKTSPVYDADDNNGGAY